MTENEERLCLALTSQEEKISGFLIPHNDANTRLLPYLAREMNTEEPDRNQANRTR